MTSIEALIVVACVVGLFVAIYFVARNVLLRRRLQCPYSGETADVQVLHRGEHGDGEALGVKSCSLLPDPAEVDCDQACLASEGEPRR